ncbi:hypothetical protein BKA70DRAFT_1216754 [Coprinopsis sp. MPI-PUGE-AT-0042]|nr:hypothetical protein BKA70DRAFT_1216754 [Coprinopsis sp. MPI-PUGE-AT-0042]
MSGSYSSQETGQVHHDQSAANEPKMPDPSIPSALQISEEDQVRDCPDGHSAIQAQGLQAPRPANQDQYQAHLKTIDNGGRQGRGDRLCDYPAMIEAEFATLERERGRRNRQRVWMEEQEADEEQGDRAEPGFLDLLGPRIKSLFLCGSRKQSQRTARQTSMRPNPRRAGDDHPGTRMTAREIVPAPDPSGNAYHPRVNDTVEHRTLQTPAASDATSRPHEGRPPSPSIDQDASPMSAMSRGGTIRITGGNFSENNIQIFQTDPSNMPTFIPPSSWADSGPTRTMRYEVTVRPIR